MNPFVQYPIIVDILDAADGKFLVKNRLIFINAPANVVKELEKVAGAAGSTSKNRILTDFYGSNWQNRIPVSVAADIAAPGGEDSDIFYISEILPKIEIKHPVKEAPASKSATAKSKKKAEIE